MFSASVSDQCVLYDRECINCGECDRCDLDPNKLCDNCMKCVMSDSDYLAIEIDEVESAQPKHAVSSDIF
ncbi:MAG: hypothetical protein IKT57_06155 [Clostridia bacterium]|nr:hypothetical protein [Clostridia bacterium]